MLTLALLCKQAELKANVKTNIFGNSNVMFKARYFPHSSLLQALVGNNLKLYLA